MTHLPQLILDLGLILGAAAVVTLLFKRLKQPLVLGYLLAGFLVGPHFNVFPTIADGQNITVWAELGVIFLLFSLGLEFSFKKLIKVGAPASITAIIEVSIMLFLGYSTGKLLGWSSIDCLFLGGVMSISSTTIIIRAFDELGVKGRQFAGLVLGILIVEDLVAILLLVLLSTLAVSKQFAGSEMLLSVGKLVFYLILWFLSGIFFIPSLLRRVKKLMSDETLLITSLALCILMVYLATLAGFSPALGAFTMGSILAETTYAEKIEHITKSVKDLFGAIFFVSVGMLIDPQVLLNYTGPVLLITLIIVTGKTLGVTLGALAAGQPLKTSIQSGTSLSQIGEFSFIIATLGLTLKVTSSFLYPIAVAVSAITTFTTPYMIKASEPIFNWVNRTLPPPVKNGLNRYSTRQGNINGTGKWNYFLRNHLLNAIFQIVIIVAVILAASNFLLPIIQHELYNDVLTRVVAVLITLLIISPFIWALTFKQPRKETVVQIWAQTKSKGAFLLLQGIRIFIAVVLIGFIIDRFFSQRIAFVTAVVILSVLILFSKRIQNFYLRIEDRFLANFYERENKETAVLAPWDAHLAVFEVNPEWTGIGKTLRELGLREAYGINVASISRGSKVINTPQRNEKIYPYDSITVIGTDDQLDRFRQALLLPMQNKIQHHKNEMVLWHFVVGPNSPFVDQSIRHSRIREKTRGIVVGIETNGRRIINPDSSYVVRPGDIIWIAGDKLRLLTIKRAEEAAAKKEVAGQNNILQ